MSRHIQGPCRATYFRNIPKKVLNLELSSGGFSVVAPGVEALEAAFEGVAEFVAEPGWAFSAARSAMVCGLVACSRRVSLRNVCILTGMKEQAVMSSECGGANALQVISTWRAREALT